MFSLPSRPVLVLALVLMGLLAACNTPPAAPTVAPTLAVTLAPTNTAGPTLTPAPTRTRFVLPPTFTPTFAMTETPTITPTVPTVVPFAPAATLPSACDGFTFDFDNSTTAFQIGAAPTVAWTPVEGAVRYRVSLGDMNGRIVKDDIYVADTSYTFDPSLFKVESTVYSWSVYPINQAGDQMCFQTGFEMSPSRFSVTPGT